MSSPPIPPAEYAAGMTAEELAREDWATLTDDQLEAEGWALGLDVWPQVRKGYTEYLRSEGGLANRQLWSLREAIRAEYLAELVAAGKVVSGVTEPRFEVSPESLQATPIDPQARLLAELADLTWDSPAGMTGGPAGSSVRADEIVVFDVPPHIEVPSPDQRYGEYDEGGRRIVVVGCTELACRKAAKVTTDPARQVFPLLLDLVGDYGWSMVGGLWRCADHPGAYLDMY